MATTENTNLPDKCPICGMEEDYRDTDNSRPAQDAPLEVYAARLTKEQALAALYGGYDD